MISTLCVGDVTACLDRLVFSYPLGGLSFRVTCYLLEDLDGVRVIGAIESTYLPRELTRTIWNPAYGRTWLDKCDSTAWGWEWREKVPEQVNGNVLWWWHLVDFTLTQYWMAVREIGDIFHRWAEEIVNVLKVLLGLQQTVCLSWWSSRSTKCTELDAKVSRRICEVLSNSAPSVDVDFRLYPWDKFTDKCLAMRVCLCFLERLAHDFVLTRRIVFSPVLFPVGSSSYDMQKEKRVRLSVYKRYNMSNIVCLGTTDYAIAKCEERTWYSWKFSFPQHDDGWDCMVYGSTYHLRMPTLLVTVYLLSIGFKLGELFLP